MGYIGTHTKCKECGKFAPHHQGVERGAWYTYLCDNCANEWM